MHSQAFLWFSVFLAIVFVLSFLWGRKGKEPSRLRLKGILGQSGKTKMPATKQSQKASVHFQTADSGNSEGKFSKSLNVMFVFNSHTFDAYEILGIPAGSSLASAKQAFDSQVAALDPEQKEFLEAAYMAIKLSKSST